jgi:hypothetical protein
MVQEEVEDIMEEAEAIRAVQEAEVHIQEVLLILYLLQG